MDDVYQRDDDDFDDDDRLPQEQQPHESPQDVTNMLK